MEDQRIVDLYWARSETAIEETQKKYDHYCRYIAFRILQDREDTEECVNDTYIHAWDAMPPHRPACLQTFLGKLTRNQALNMFRRQNAQKRGAGAMEAIVDECASCVPQSEAGRDVADDIALRDALNRFLWSLPAETRRIFLRRYWYMNSIPEIAKDFRMSESKVKMSLLRTRNKLKEYLKEGELWV